MTYVHLYAYLVQQQLETCVFASCCSQDPGSARGDSSCGFAAQLAEEFGLEAIC